MNTIDEFKKCIIENKIPYPDKDEIPEIKLKDLLSEEKIKNYLNTLTNYDDSKFYKCNKCKIDENKFFCEKCRKNFCDNCCKVCRNDDHSLINLQDTKFIYWEYKKEIL